MTRGPCSSARSKSIPTTPWLWLKAPRLTLMIGSTGGAIPGPTTMPKCSDQPIERSLSPPTMYGCTSPKADYLDMSGRPGEALDAADAGLAINPNVVPLLYATRHRRKFPRPIRTGEGRCGARDALEPARPVYGRIRTSTWATRRSASAISTPRLTNIARRSTSGLHRFFAYTNLAAAYAHAGKMDEAKAALAEARRLNPAITVKWMKEHAPNLPAVFDGLRKAGLPRNERDPKARGDCGSRHRRLQPIGQHG